MKVAKNLISRILTGVIFVSVILTAILCGKYSFALIVALIEVLALFEFYHLINTSAKAKVNRCFNAVGGLLLFAASFVYFSGILVSSVVFLPYILYFLVLFISELYLKKENPISSLAYSVLGQVYLAVPFSMLNYIAFSYDGEYHYAFILAMFVLIWVNDSFAYVSGVTMGKHKMFERISPKKSWEGFVGGAVCAILASLAFAHFFPAFPTFVWVGFSIIIIVFGTLGDLIESLFKRTLGIKDSGTILPGHGGILDRFDSFIFAIPALVVYLGTVAYFTGS